LKCHTIGTQLVFCLILFLFLQLVSFELAKLSKGKKRETRYQFQRYSKNHSGNKKLQKFFVKLNEELAEKENKDQVSYEQYPLRNINFEII